VDWIGESIAEAVRESLVSKGVPALEREDRLEAFRRLSLRSNVVLTRASIIKAGALADPDVGGSRRIADRCAHSRPEAFRTRSAAGRGRAAEAHFQDTALVRVHEFLTNC
jgi:hypothetical protein